MNADSQRRDQDLAAYTDYDKKRKNRKKIRAIVIIAIALVLVALIVFLMTKYLFTVKEIIIDGVERYGYSEIKETAGINENSVIYLLREKRIERVLKEKYPYIREVKLKKSYPSTVTLTITEETPLYYFEYDDEYFVITSELKILEIFKEKERMETYHKGLKRVFIPRLGSGILSKDLELYDSKDTRHIKEVLTVLSEWNEFSYIDDIDMQNRFDVSVMYDGRLKLEFGSKKDLETKLRFVSGIISGYSAKATGRIIIDSADEAVARVDDPETPDKK